MKIHTLKTWPEFLSQVVDGKKPFEVRYDDKNFQVGDWLHLWEYDPGTPTTPGAFGELHAFAPVTYKLALNDCPGLAAMLRPYVKPEKAGRVHVVLDDIVVLGMDMQKLQYVRRPEAVEALVQRIKAGEV